ncbi:hypothetical protein VP01_11337g1 [Puccinia sorghi]|uniref:Uncharacterized protein n=1 Tax=Puccinia sorghi TaxID=27349 RepID=A0A0L6VS25_9BASI|nr:hypothetical protein VP01_11337g1 [Puccinia sorghi]
MAIDKTFPASRYSQVPNASSNPPKTTSATNGETSENPPPDLSNRAVPLEPANQTAAGDTQHPTTSVKDNKTQKSRGLQPEPQSSDASQSSTPTNTNLTIMLKLDAQIEKYQGYWESLSSHIKFRAKPMQNITPIKHDFHFERASCSYASSYPQLPLSSHTPKFPANFHSL